jgi:hypothetical protein
MGRAPARARERKPQRDRDSPFPKDLWYRSVHAQVNFRLSEACVAYLRGLVRRWYAIQGPRVTLFEGTACDHYHPPWLRYGLCACAEQAQDFAAARANGVESLKPVLPSRGAESSESLVRTSRAVVVAGRDNFGYLHLGMQTKLSAVPTTTTRVV